MNTTTTTTIGNMCINTLTRWEFEEMRSAKRAQAKGIEGDLVVYPTGLKKIRFGEPFGKDFGMFYEVNPEVWDYLKNGGKIIVSENY